MRAALSFASLAPLAVCCFFACASDPAVRAAERGDLATLKSTIDGREKGGHFKNKDAAEIAKAVAQHDIEQAKPDDAEERVREVVACAHELEDALAHRRKTHDAAGAIAALAMFEAGDLDAGDAREFAGDSDEHWRAFGVRGLDREKDRSARTQALVDTSPFVRREAARAARRAADAADLPALLETARVDPEPLVRTEAIRTIAMLPAASDGTVARKLHDLWPAADEPLREDIAVAWASPNVLKNGGRDELLVVLAQDHGPATLEAAAAVLRLGDHADREVSEMAVAQLLRTIDSASRRDRLHALAIARFDRPDLSAALEKATKDDDLEVRVAALSRMTENLAKKQAAVRDLEAFAGAPNPLRTRALLALGSAGDVGVQRWMEDVLGSGDASERLAGAAALVALGRSARAAPLLADGDPSVRTRAACLLLMAARIRGD